MSALEDALADYLRCATGSATSWPTPLGCCPVRGLDGRHRPAHDHHRGRAGLVPAAAGGPGSAVWPRRMTAVRGFARYLSGIDPATEVPPLGLLPGRQRWRPPFIYTPDDIDALLAGARRLRSPLRAATYETLIGLLAVTGMRIGEAIGLDRGDVDCDAGVLLIRESKFGKSRLVPLHPTTVAALDAYAGGAGSFPSSRATTASSCRSPAGG